jgi:glucosamine 6-phosphate synthetase-like amidotransferase/phosphosugar isomerase protein
MAEFLEKLSEHRFSIKGSTPLVLSSQLSRNKLGVAVAEAPVWVGICDNRNDYVARFDITACLQLATQIVLLINLITISLGYCERRDYGSVHRVEKVLDVVLATSFNGIYPN